MMKEKSGEFIKKNSGEVIWGSEAFIEEVFKTLYGKKWGETFESYNDALHKIKNLVQKRRVYKVNLTYEEQVYLRLLMHDTWFSEVKNRASDSDKKLHKSIHQKLSQELINA